MVSALSVPEAVAEAPVAEAVPVLLVLLAFWGL
jgi:hypothetical protein